MGRSRRNALREARVMVLEALFSREYSEDRVLSPKEAFSAKDDLDQKSRDFRDRLLSSIQANQPALDSLIANTASGWTIDRMAKVERNILRIGAYEILHEADIPFRVSIDEALEMAHQYCEPEAVAFINGILHRIGMEHSPEKAMAPVPQREDPGS